MTLALFNENIDVSRCPHKTMHFDLCYKSSHIGRDRGHSSPAEMQSVKT